MLGGPRESSGSPCSASVRSVSVSVCLVTLLRTQKALHTLAQVLKLRSSELKLRKELEGTQSGYDATRRQLTTLSADRAALRQMMDALQEGKRVCGQRWSTSTKSATWVSSISPWNEGVASKFFILRPQQKASIDSALSLRRYSGTQVFYEPCNLTVPSILAQEVYL